MPVNNTQPPQSIPGFAEAMNYQSPLESTPVQNSGSDTWDSYYGSYQYESYDSISLIYDTDVSNDLYVDMVSESEQAPNYVFIEQEPHQLKTIIFISKNDSKLQKTFEETTPADNEICLFLEDNTGDLLSDRSYYIKVGSIYQEYLREVKNNGDLSNYLEPTQEFQYDNDDTSLNLQFTEEEIDQLINDGEITSESSAWGYATVKVVTFFLRNAKPIYAGLAYGILESTKFIKSYIKFQPHHWDPEAERQDDTEFNPILFPLLPSAATQANILDTFETTLTAFKNANSQYLDRLSSINFSILPAGLQPFAQSFQDIVTQIKEHYNTIATYIIRNVREMISFFAGVGSRYIQVINAYYCGLWNSLIDSILGIPELLGYFFKGLELAADAAENIEVIYPKIKETLDEIIQLAFSTDWLGMFTTFISSVGSGLLSLATTATSSISLEKFFYFMGAVAGFILELVLGFFTAGTATAASISSKLGQMGKMGKFAQIIIDVVLGINTVVNTVTETIIGTLFKMIGWLFSVIRKGKEELGKFIRLIFRKISDIAEVTQEIIEAFLARIGFSFDDFSRIRSFGINFVDVNDARNGARLIQNCT